MFVNSKLSITAKACRQFIGRIIAVEGGIGAGKSTFGQTLTEYLTDSGLRARYYPEYINQKLLSQYIGDMKKYAYSFQMVMLTMRINIYREAVDFARTGGIAVIDRSLVGDYTFAKMQKETGRISDSEWESIST